MKTIRMPKELLAKWLAALRSGEYKQVDKVLYDSHVGGYCCLGVLQHVACGETISADDEEVPAFDWLNAHGVSFTGQYGQAGNPFLPALKTSAADANDSGRTFIEIADAIEACAEGT